MLLAADLKLKPKKCSFFQEQSDCLGFIINKTGLQPQPSKIEAITKMQRPTNKRDIQVFLGMIGYYRQFIPLFSVTTQHLFKLLKLDVKFTWSSQCESAFIALKNKMIEHPILVYPNFEKEFIVQTDNSLYAVGFVLSKLDDNGEERAIAYAAVH